MDAATYNEKYIKALEKQNKDLAAYIQKLERERHYDSAVNRAPVKARVKQPKEQKEPARVCHTDPVITVQITYGREGLWYSCKEGERFRVRSNSRYTFAVNETGKLIGKDDCIVVSIDYGNEEAAGNGRPVVQQWNELE